MFYCFSGRKIPISNLSFNSCGRCCSFGPLSGRLIENIVILGIWWCMYVVLHQNLSISQSFLFFKLLFSWSFKSTFFFIVHFIQWWPFVFLFQKLWCYLFSSNYRAFHYTKSSNWIAAISIVVFAILSFSRGFALFYG